MFDIYLPHWEYDAGVICRIASVLVFQKVLKRYYISNAVTYLDYAINDYTKNKGGTLSEMSDPIIMPLLSPEGLDLVWDGAQHTRTEKTANIANNPFDNQPQPKVSMDKFIKSENNKNVSKRQCTNDV